MCYGNVVLSCNKYNSHLSSNDGVFNYCLPNSYSYNNAPHNPFISCPPFIPSSYVAQFNNHRLFPQNSDWAIFQNFQNYCQPVPGSKFMVPAPAQCVPLTAGSIYQSSVQFNSTPSVSSVQSKIPVPRIFEWLPATEGNLSGQKTSKNMFLSASSANISATSHVVNADSGSSGIYIAVKDTNCLIDVQQCTKQNKIQVTVANGHNIESSHIGKLIVPSGHNIAAYIFPKN